MKTFTEIGKVEEGIVDTILAAATSPIVAPKVLAMETAARLTNRLGDEYGAHYFYRAATDWCKNQGFFKAAEYFAKEMTDELEHAKLIRDYATDWNLVLPIPEALHNHSFSSLVDIINQAYMMEYTLFTAYIADSSALFPLDLASFDFLKQLRDIQTESVAQYSVLLNGLNLININNRLDILYFENQYFS